MAETYRPPQGVRDEAKRALDWIADGKAGSGFTDTGRKRAADLARGAAISAETVLRIHSYLSRHEVDKNGKGFSPGDDGYPSPGRVAWAAWGGDPAMSWSSKIRDQLADRSALLEESMETRELPPSYRPAASDDVPKFTPACASCIYLLAGVDETGQQSLRCTKWEASVAPDSYCDAWEVNEDCLPAWMQDDEDHDEETMTEQVPETPVDSMETDSADLDVEARRSLIEACEKRTVETELRAERGTDGVLRVRGYAATWDREATGLSFREVIKPGAFKRSLERGDDVFLLVNHDTDQLPLARRSAGTLTLTEDETGLLIDAELDPKNPRAAELGSALERGDVDKMSFAFTVAEGGSTRTKDGLRELSDLNLFEVSVVTWPAYADTTVGLRNAEVDDLDFRKRVLSAKIRHLVLEV
jgi:HK97 family phage prohead protease